MARKFLTGFETGDTAVFDSTSTTSPGSLSITTAAKRSGSYGLQIDKASGSNGIAFVRNGVTSGARIWSISGGTEKYARFYFKLQSGFSTATHAIIIAAIRNSSAGNIVYIRTLTQVNNECQIQLWAGSGPTTFYTITDFTKWYRLEIGGVDGDPAGTVTAKIYDGDSTSELGSGSKTPLVNTSLWAIFDTGMISLVAGSGTATWYYDDIALNNNVGSDNNSWCGPGSIYQTAIVTGAGTKADFTPSAGSNYQNVDEWPPDDATTYNETPSGSPNQREDWHTLSNYSGPNTVQAVSVVIRWTNVALNAGANHEWGLLDSGTLPTGTSINSLSAYSYQGMCHGVRPYDGTSAWTNAAFNACEVGYYRELNDGTSQRDISAIICEVEDDTVTAPPVLRRIFIATT